MRTFWATVTAVLSVLAAGPAQAQAQTPVRTAVPWDVQALMSPPTLSEVAISPDGSQLASAVRQGNAYGLIVRDIETNQPRTLLSFSFDQHGAGRQVVAIYWQGADRLLVHIRARRAMFTSAGRHYGHENLDEFLAIGSDGSNPVEIETSGTAFQREGVIDPLPDDPDHVLMQLRDDRDFLSAYRVNLLTGDRTLVAQGNIGTRIYFADGAGQVVARVRVAGSTGRWGLIEGLEANGSWTRIADYFASDIRQTSDFEFVGAGQRPGELYAIVRPAAGSTPDTAAIHSYDLTARTLGPRIAQHDTYDMAGLLLDGNTREPLAGCYQADMWRCDFIDPAARRQMAGLLRFFDNERDIRVVSQDRERRRWVLSVSGATEPQTYYLYDTQTQSVDIIDEGYADMAALPLAEMRRVDYQARDSQALHGYLSVPTGPGPYPTIVLPHGGPEARDAIGFDPWVQFLTGRGYAVFQPNFRGSSGFGRAFAEAGYRQWGLRMQDDVTDGLQALIAQGVADPEQVCIMGASYGGYAALWGGASQPETYRCVISIAGVSDLRAMMQWTRLAYGSDSETLNYWETAIGEARRDRAQLEAVSPIEHVETWRPPVLLIHGSWDYVVPVSQSVEMNRALRQAGRDVTYVEFEGADHNFYDRNGARLLIEVGNFLAVHLPTPRNPSP